MATEDSSEKDATQKGGGFDQNWVIRRNTDPIAITIHTPNKVENPTASSDVTCSVGSVHLASRTTGQATEIIVEGNGNIRILASGNISIIAKGNVTVVGATITLN